MSLFKRPVINTDGLVQKARQGEGMYGNPVVVTLADANATLTIAQLSGGVIQANFTGARNITTPTAAQLAAANPGMDIGDSFMFWVSTISAQALTFVAGTGVILQGRGGVAGLANAPFIVTRTGAAAFTWNGL